MMIDGKIKNSNCNIWSEKKSANLMTLCLILEKRKYVLHYVVNEVLYFISDNDEEK